MARLAKGHALITVSMAVLGLAIIISAQNSPIVGAIAWVRSKVTQHPAAQHPAAQHPAAQPTASTGGVQAVPSNAA
ncbi:MAG: hypothetical protein KGJ45_11485 [Elusimicrobia bacterium]|nr:hypothetical protein [Elusimicrobiota bacterium]